MHRFKKLISLALAWLLCWTTVTSPMAVYASTTYDGQSPLVQDGAMGDGAATSDESTDDEVDDVPDTEDTEEENAPSDIAADSQNSIVTEETQGSESAVLSGAGETETALSETEDLETDSSDSVGDTWSLANSWRYTNGVPVNEQPSVSLYSMSTPPAGATLQGVDVSSHNGNIDWSKVKSAGIDFAILRLGYADVEMDKQFMNNVRGCQQNGIPFGVYVYSYAWDATSAAREGEGAVARLQQAGLGPDDLSLPVYFDIENTNPDTGKPSGINGTTYVEISGGTQTFADMATSFLAPLQACGYEVGVYSSLSWWRTYLSSPVFNQWNRWVAQWNTSCTYEGEYTLWQYTSSGSVPGISGAVDLNWWYGAPDTSAVEINSEIEGSSVTLNASGFTVDPDNVAFEVLSPSGAGRWYQAADQGDGSWSVDAPVFSDMGEVGGYVVRAGATIDGVAGATAEASAAFSAGEISVSAGVAGGSLELSASGWLVPPRNVAFEVLSPSGVGRWYQGVARGDGSWAADAPAGADFGEWGEYSVNAWASYGQDTRAYGNSPTAVLEKVSISYSIYTPYGNTMSGSDGVQASSWNGSFVENVCGVSVSIKETPVEGSISYQGYIHGSGWTSAGSNGSLAGSSSSSSVFSAVKISLNGEISEYCDIWYSVYVEDFGSLGWTKNGSITGSTNLPLKVQAISIVARPKGSAAPGSTANSLLTSYPYVGYQNPSQYYQVSNRSVAIPHLGEGIFGYRTESRIPYNASREDCVNAMIQRAYEYMGTQYVWDYACAPGVGVDCAGLVLQCLYATGMDLSPMNPWDHYYLGLSGGWHSAYANYMWTSGRFQRVPLSQRQRGDIISWNGHVAIYIGNDQIIEATPPRVRISNLWYLGTPRGVLRPFV